MKKSISFILVMLMVLCMVPGVSLATEYVAKVGEIEYSTLKEAVDEANKIDGGGTITLLKDVTLSEKLTIKKNITISGEYTITRGIAGTIFVVDKNATLTLDGGVVIDGGNNWTFDSEQFYADMAAGLTLSTGAKESYSTSGGIESTAVMISINGNNGKVVMNQATIQNNWGKAIFHVPAGATYEMNTGSLIQHIRGRITGDDSMGGKWIMNGGKIDGVHGHNANGGLVYIGGSGSFIINDGEICNITLLGLNANGNGILAQVYKESSKLIINGGKIYNNASFSPGGGWGSVVYLNRGGDFEMNGGIIEANASDHCTAFVSNTSTSIVLNKGTIKVPKSCAASFDSLIYGDITIGKDMEIKGEDGSTICILGDTDDSFKIEGTIEGDNIQLMVPEVSEDSTGTIEGNVIIKPDTYFEFDGKVIISGGEWKGTLTVDEQADLTITGGIFAQDVSKWVEDGTPYVVRNGKTYVGAAVDNAPPSTDEPTTPTPTPTPDNPTEKPQVTPKPTEKPASSGIKVEYNGGNSFSTSKGDVPTSVEIDGVPVPFSGNGSSFTVGCIDPNAKWVTVKWNSTTVTVNFTPDVNVVCTEIGIPKTGDMSIWAAIAEFFGF